VLCIVKGNAWGQIANIAGRDIAAKVLVQAIKPVVDYRHENALASKAPSALTKIDVNAVVAVFLG
jgi:hypothetical protein